VCRTRAVADGPRAGSREATASETLSPLSSLGLQFVLRHRRAVEQRLSQVVMRHRVTCLSREGFHLRWSRVFDRPDSNRPVCVEVRPL
jgi:hypothetical protein